jgi:hypothetical protein
VFRVVLTISMTVPLCTVDLIALVMEMRCDSSIIKREKYKKSKITVEITKRATPLFLSSILDGDDLLVLRSGRFIPG